VAAAESVLHTGLGRQLILRDALAPLRGEYDYILIDRLPTNNILVVNALAAADFVLMPVQTDYLATRGLAQMLQEPDSPMGALNDTYVLNDSRDRT
jgi:chromosome partitioning protein